MNSAASSLSDFYRSSIGKKLVVAITGLGLIAFLFGHMAGNLKIYAGPDKINGYAAWLHSMPAILWAARIGLLGCFFGHIITTILLVKQNRAARGDIAYACKATMKASGASRTMIWSGIIILSFVIYHLMHYTMCIGNEYESASYLDAAGRHNVFKMLVDGFSWYPASIFYIISRALLCWHLSQGFASCFQTLGLRGERSWPLIKAAGYAVAAIIFIGNCSIPISVLAGWLHY
jgi:succinate dehydrogenase / fumarate reductase cytochrome b subunit